MGYVGTHGAFSKLIEAFALPLARAASAAGPAPGRKLRSFDISCFEWQHVRQTRICTDAL